MALDFVAVIIIGFALVGFVCLWVTVLIRMQEPWAWIFTVIGALWWAIWWLKEHS